MAQAFRCICCEQEEDRCTCDRYCCMCQGGNDPRLCQDGQYYCLDCREACEYSPQAKR